MRTLRAPRRTRQTGNRERRAESGAGQGPSATCACCLGTPKPRFPAASRQEVRDQERARKAADARVDWRRVRDGHRAPELRYSDADGCGSIFVYGWSEDRTEAIRVQADAGTLQLSLSPQTYDIALRKAEIEVLVHVVEQPHGRWPFCTDAIVRTPEETWRAIGGVMTIEVSPPGASAREPYLRRATIRMVGAEFVSATGARVRQAQPITLTALVGRVAG